MDSTEGELRSAAADMNHNSRRLVLPTGAAIAAAFLVTVVLLAIAATTTWLDSALGIGSHLSAGSDLGVVDRDGTHRAALTRDPGMMHWGPAWSRDGRSLIYSFGVPSRHADQLMIATANGAGRHQLTNNGRENYLAAWSPNGRQIAYISQAGTNTRTAELMVIRANGLRAKRLTANHAWEYGASWSPDGRRIAFGSQQGGTWRVWTMNSDGSGSHPVRGTGEGNAPDWSPDGRTIVFTSDRTGNDNIYVVNAAGGTARRLTSGPCHSDNARWSPDGRQIIYAVFCDHGWNDIYIMDANGRHPRNLTRTPDVEEEVPAWLPNGRRIGFAAFRVERNSLWPGPAIKALGIGLLLGLVAAGLMLLRSRLAPVLSHRRGERLLAMPRILLAALGLTA